MAKNTFKLIPAVVGVFSAVACIADTPRQENKDYSVLRLEVGRGESALLVTDLDGDDRADLVVAAESQGTVGIRLGDGSGGLGEMRSYPAGDNPTGLANADFNSDGHQDLVVANHERPYASVLLGQGGGRFKAEPLRVPLDVAPHSHRVAAADLNDDQKTDLIVDSRDKLGLYVVTGDGAGEFLAPGSAIDAMGAPYLGFAVGDLNGDKRPDIVTPNRDSLSVLLNNSTDAISFAFKQSIPLTGAFAVGVGDFDGDGHLDVIAASERDGQNVGIYLGKGDGTLIPSPIATRRIAAGAKALAVGDTDGDGNADAVVCAWSGSATVLSLAGGQELTANELPLDAISNPWGLAVGDLNRDGRDDIVISDGESSVANVYLTAGGSK